MWEGTPLTRDLHHCARPPLKPHLAEDVYLHENFVMVIKGLPIFPVVEGRHPHNLLLLVDDGHGQYVLNDPPGVIHGAFLQGVQAKLRTVLGLALARA